jgi:hypothetical protein
MAVNARGLNASLELANMEMEAKERAKKHVANLLRVGFFVIISMWNSLMFKNV